MTGEDVGWGDGGSLFLSELTAPGDALLRLGSLATIVVFQIAGCLLALLLPVMPAFRTDMTSQVAIHKERVAIITPRTAKIDFINPFCSDEATVVEDIAVGNICWCGGSSNVTVDEALDGAVLKPCRRGAEDEISSAADIAAIEIDAGVGHASVDCILMAYQATVDDLDSVSLSMKGV